MESNWSCFSDKDDLLDAEGDETKVGKRLKDTTKQTYVKTLWLDCFQDQA